MRDHLQKLDEIIAKASNGIVSTAGFKAAQDSPSSAAVFLTGGIEPAKKKKKIEKSEAEGLITTVDGKKLKLTGLTDKEKDEYLFGRAELKKANEALDNIINRLSQNGSSE